MKKKGHIIIEYGVFFLVVFFVMTSVVALLTFVSTILMAVESESETAYTRAYNAEEVIVKHRGYPFLVEYWTDHIKDIKEMIGDGEKADELLDEGEELLSKYGASELALLTEEMFSTMNEEEKKILALLSYQSVAEDFSTINNMQKVTLDGPMLVSVSDTGEMIMLIKMGDSPFEVGDEIKFFSSNIWSLYAGAKSGITHAEQNIVAISYGNGKTYSAVAYPVENDGKVVAITLIGAFDNYIKYVSFSQTFRIIISIVIIAAVSGVILLLMLYYGLIGPIEKTQMGVRAYTQNFQTEALVNEMKHIKSKNEIGRLADDIGVMAERIQEYSNERTALAAEKARMDSEFSLAANIQKSVLSVNFPDPEIEKRFELYAFMKPAKAVGGDFYEFFMVDDDHLVLLIADVSDKGIAAAMFMMTSKTVISNNIMNERSPAKVLKNSNNTLSKNNDEKMFVTVWLGILQLSTGLLVACNAGHESPMLRKAGGLFAKTNDKRSLMVGAFEDVDYMDYELQLGAGDKLFLFTDGVPDAADAEVNRFGFDRIIASLNKEPDASPNRMIENVRSDVGNFVKGAEQFDDITMLAVEYKGL